MSSLKGEIVPPVVLEDDGAHGPRTLPPIVYVVAPQFTTMLVTFTGAHRPVPPETRNLPRRLRDDQITLYEAPGTGAVNVNGPSAVAVRSFPPLSARTIATERPEIVPPIEYSFAAQVTVTLVTFAPATVPDPFATVSRLPGWLMREERDSRYALEFATGVAKANVPFALRVRLSLPLSWRTTVPKSRGSCRRR